MVVQDEMKDCGVCCLQMIIKYYGGYVNKETLLELTKTSKNGTTAYHIKEASISLGFEAKGISCKLDEINNKNIILPCIANVIIDDSYKHFVVIYEINLKRQYLIIGDPADKIKKVSYADFEEIYNDVLITLFPIKTLQVEKEISYFDFIYSLIKNHQKILLNIFILSIFITLFSIITSFYTEYMINGLSTYSKYHLLLIFCIFFSIYILKILSNYFRNILLSYVNQKLDIELTLDIYSKILKLPYCYYKNRTTGDVLSRINDLGNIREMISKVSISIFVDLPLTIVSLIVLYLINNFLFKIGLIILILYLILMTLFKKIFENYIKKIQIKRSETNSYIIESISAFETIKGNHLENKIINRFEKKYVKFLTDIFNYQKLYFIQNFLKELLNDIGFILILFIGCILVLDNKINLGTLFTFSSLLVYFLDPIKNIINLDNIVKEAKNSLRRILELIPNYKDNNGIVNKYKNGDIVFKNLNFSFDDRNYILKNINLCIKKNSKVMIVGKSGSGKSTLFKLLMKYYKIKNNTIFIGDVDLNNYDLNVINDNIVYLSQNEILFNDTLYNNLVFDNSNKHNLLNIVKMCFIDEIMDKNLGFNMLIEENGFNLSGGERQRISLARTLLKKFSILIIDEGLSQVDIDLERKILNNIFKYFEDKTIIVISHRLDNLDLFDDLIKIENGVVKNERKKNE